VSIRPLYKIEDRLRSRQADTTVTVRIHRAAREPTIVREQSRVEDAIEVIDRSIAAIFLNVALKCQIPKENLIECLTFICQVNFELIFLSISIYIFYEKNS